MHGIAPPRAESRSFPPRAQEFCYSVRKSFPYRVRNRGHLNLPVQPRFSWLLPRRPRRGVSTAAGCSRTRAHASARHAERPSPRHGRKPEPDRTPPDGAPAFRSTAVNEAELSGFSAACAVTLAASPGSSGTGFRFSSQRSPSPGYFSRHSMQASMSASSTPTWRPGSCQQSSSICGRLQASRGSFECAWRDEFNAGRRAVANGPAASVARACVTVAASCSTCV